jgi:hypothetical protein
VGTRAPMNNCLSRSCLIPVRNRAAWCLLLPQVVKMDLAVFRGEMRINGCHS